MVSTYGTINPFNAELNLVCHLLALLGAHHILHVSRIRVKLFVVTRTPISSNALNDVNFKQTEIGNESHM